jgi:hypothetical protein
MRAGRIMGTRRLSAPPATEMRAASARALNDEMGFVMSVGMSTGKTALLCTALIS